MAALNLSTNGPSITKSYQSVVNAPQPSGPAAASPTYGQWAIFAVQAPLVSAFQHDAGKESVLKVQSSGEGELVDLIDEFSDGRIQFAFVKVKDPNTALPKNVLIAWCGEGVPERTKGYFTSHLAAVSKVLHGYHVQVTARSERDLTPESIVQKVADSSGSKYAGDKPITSASSLPPPTIGSKPVFTPTRIGGTSSAFSPLGSRAAASATSQPTDDDGWGADAPPVTRTQLEKVAPAYRPTKVNMADLRQQRESTGYNAESRPSNGASDVVKGGYQPVGKVDIAAIRRAAQEKGDLGDDRPVPVKGTYEPVGKVDIAAIRARAQGAGSSASPSAPAAAEYPASSHEQEAPKSLADRSATFQQAERLTALPKPKVANRFGGGSTFAGTKAPTPAGYSQKPTSAAAPPVGIASRTFADEGGKTPAQVWAEKKARERGSTTISPNETGPSLSSPIKSQVSGEGGWKSGYTGKTWAPVQTTHTGQSAGSGVSAHRTGEQPRQLEDESASPSGGVSAIRDRFAGAPPMGAPSSRPSATAQPPLDLASKPNSGARGVPIPGLPTRPAEERIDLPLPPAQPRSPAPDEAEERQLEEAEDDATYRPSSPIRVAMPVSRGPEPEARPVEELHRPPTLPTTSMSQVASASRALPTEPQEEEEDPARRIARAAAASDAITSEHGAAVGGITGGRKAIAQYDYEKAEDNEIELREGSYVHDIDMVDTDWWMGTNEQGERGLFPSNYVELVDDGDSRDVGPGAAVQKSEPEPVVERAPPGGFDTKSDQKPTATAQYDYEAAEDNELSFPDGAKILNVEFPDEDWWLGEYGGKTGLFPANYVQLDE